MEMQEQSAGEVHRDYIKEGVAQAGSDAPERQPGVVEDDPVLQAQHCQSTTSHDNRKKRLSVSVLGGANIKRPRARMRKPRDGGQAGMKWMSK